MRAGFGPAAITAAADCFRVTLFRLAVVPGVGWPPTVAFLGGPVTSALTGVAAAAFFAPRTTPGGGPLAAANFRPPRTAPGGGPLPAARLVRFAVPAADERLWAAFFGAGNAAALLSGATASFATAARLLPCRGLGRVALWAPFRRGDPVARVVRLASVDLARDVRTTVGALADSATGILAKRRAMTAASSGVETAAPTDARFARRRANRRDIRPAALVRMRPAVAIAVAAVAAVALPSGREIVTAAPAQFAVRARSRGTIARTGWMTSAPAVMVIKMTTVALGDHAPKYAWAVATSPANARLIATDRTASSGGSRGSTSRTSAKPGASRKKTSTTAGPVTLGPARTAATATKPTTAAMAIGRGIQSRTIRPLGCSAGTNLSSAPDRGEEITEGSSVER
ncbi:MAG: hypothetical protein E6I26_07570 [Chloroflexi bacterium]|nr:MAG: hypothetical protein E6I26_07570 [Chloroflexota bacterium]